MGDNVKQAKGIANMARVFDLETATDDIRKNLARSIQSANLNFLIGSGASYPAIPTAGAVEAEIASLFEAGNEDGAYLKLYDFLATIQAPTNSLIANPGNAKVTTTVANIKPAFTWTFAPYSITVLRLKSDPSPSSCGK